MKDGYDLSGGRRGLFFRRDAALIASIYLDADILASPQGRAERQGVSLDTLVNTLLRQALGSAGTSGRVDA